MAARRAALCAWSACRAMAAGSPATAAIAARRRASPGSAACGDRRSPRRCVLPPPMRPMPSKAISTRPSVNDTSAAPARAGSTASTDPRPRSSASRGREREQPVDCWRGRQRRIAVVEHDGGAGARQVPRDDAPHDFLWRAPAARADTARRSPSTTVLSGTTLVLPAAVPRPASGTRPSVVPPSTSPGFTVRYVSWLSRIVEGGEDAPRFVDGAAAHFRSEDLRRMRRMTGGAQRPARRATSRHHRRARITGAVLEADRDVGPVRRLVPGRPPRERHRVALMPSSPESITVIDDRRSSAPASASAWSASRMMTSPPSCR